MQDRTPGPPNGGEPIPDFTPVPRLKPRHDGWTPERQRALIDAIADTGSVTDACKRLNMSTEGAYVLKRAPGAEEFAAAWDAALDFGIQSLADLAIDRIRHGTPVPVFWKASRSVSAAAITSGCTCSSSATACRTLWSGAGQGRSQTARSPQAGMAARIHDRE